MPTSRVQRRIATALLALGVALMAVTITVESEPGAIPLLLVVLGGGWRLALRRCARGRGG